MGPNLWSFDPPVDLSAYAVIGINYTNILFAKNYTVKSVTIENKVEIQTVSQSTSLV
jgi:hypothetical protein